MDLLHDIDLAISNRQTVYIEIKGGNSYTIAPLELVGNDLKCDILGVSNLGESQRKNALIPLDSITYFGGRKGLG